MNEQQQQTQSLFERLAKIDCSEHIEQKFNGQIALSYLSWAWAWQILKINCPSATYEVREWDGKPYLFDEDLGYLVETKLTCEGISLSQRLPVMDGANKSMTNKAYTYKTKYGEKSVAPATMFDINTAIQRCLVKNIAMFGLGLNVYAGEDLPISQEQISGITTSAEDDKTIFSARDKREMNSCKTIDELNAYCAKRKDEIKGSGVAKLIAYYKEIKPKFTK